MIPFGWLTGLLHPPRPAQEPAVTTMPPPNTALADYLHAKPWYQRYAKGIAAAVAGLVNLAWLLSVLPSNVVPTGVAVAVALGVQFIVGIIGVVAVPNSPTAKQLQQVEDYVGRHRKPE